MGASTFTPNLNLPLFSDDDRPSWRGDINGMNNTLDADSATIKGSIAALKSISLGVNTDTFRNGANYTGDQSAMLNAWLADTTLSGIRRLVGTFNISSGIVVPAGVSVDARQATLIQTTPNTALVTLAPGARFYKGNLIGITTDYIARTGSFTPTSFGIKVSGTSAMDTYIEGSTLTGFGQASIYVDTAPRTHINGVSIHGPNGVNGVTIPAGDAGACGVYVNRVSPDMSVNDLWVDNCSIGFINSVDSSGLILRGARFRSIVGQHGAYIQNGTDTIVSDLNGDTVNLDLIKLQIHADVGAHQFSPKFSGITGTNIGDTVLTLVNVDPTLTNGYKFFAPVVSGVTGYNSGRVLYLSSCVGASVENVSGYNTTNDMLTIIDCQDSVVSNIASHGSGKLGIRLSTLPGSVTSRLSIKNARIYNPGGSNVAGSTMGMNSNFGSDINDGTNITVSDAHVYADNGNMTAGIEYDKIDTSTLRQRNCVSFGHTTRAFILPSGTTALKEWSNNDNNGSPTLNYPLGAVVKIGSNGDAGEYSSNVMPVTGIYLRGAICKNNSASASGSPGWINTATGGAYSSTWSPSTAYAAGVQVRTSGGQVILCITGGTSGATEPTMPAINQTVNDNGIVWKFISNTIAAFKAMANVSA